MRKLELLAPAANVDIARQAILHGADAVYIGGPSHGARKSASNSIADIRSLADFAHTFRARVYVTVNTIVKDSELSAVERLIRDLYRAGVDALIVQDMGILRLDIPPIALHASTQCDNRTPAKARFLQDVGFSQIVLARELTLKEIKSVCDSVSVPVETFIHGALCVSYSGRCHASQACLGRSANRGECAQICRWPYNLRDASGRVLQENRHLLSLKDLNASDRIGDLLDAGVSSFKIEGRLKDADYVRNVTAHYSRLLDSYVAAEPDKYVRESFGRSEFGFQPDPDKSFNRGFTHYFLDGRPSQRLSNPFTPKSMGERITEISSLRPGDGIGWIDADGEYRGATVNGIDHGRILSNRPLRLPKGVEIRRTFNREWQNQLKRDHATRRIGISVEIDAEGVTASDERGCRVRLPLGFKPEAAERPIDPERVRQPFAKLGNTNYFLSDFFCRLPQDVFLPVSALTELRRRQIEALDSANRATYHFDVRRKEDLSAEYPEKEVDFRENVANRLAFQFYRDHGVNVREMAMEVGGHKAEPRTRLMTTRHCILRDLGMCRKEGKAAGVDFPLYLESGPNRFELEFDCARCEMHVLS